MNVTLRLFCAICLAAYFIKGSSHAEPPAADAHPAQNRANADASDAGKHPTEKASGAANVSKADSADLPVSRVDREEPVSSLKPSHQFPGKGISKSAAKNVPSKNAPQPPATAAASKKTLPAPMASAEAASTQKKAALPTSPMAAAEAASVQKKMADLHDSGPKGLEKVEVKPASGPIHDYPSPVLSRQPGSSLNGTSSAAPRSKLLPLAVIDGSKISKTNKGAAAVSGTGIR